MAALAEDVPQDYYSVLTQSRGGFNFENCERNLRLVQKVSGDSHFPKAKKTGTTICGIVCAGCVVLGADTRATAGSIVADKNADKLHPIADNIQCAGAGTSADLTATTELMERQMEIHRLNTGRQIRVCTVVRRLSNMLFQYQGHIGCHLVLGGVDCTGPHLYQIAAHGSTDKLPYTTMGSGMIAAMSVLELGYREDLTLEEGKELVADAIAAGVFNDLGSGGNVDVCTINQNGEKNHQRAYREPNQRKYKADFKPFPKGATPLMGKSIYKERSVKVENGNTLDGDGDVVMR